MQIGIITVDGQQIGIVTQSTYTPDLTMPLLGTGEIPMSSMHGDLGGDVGGGPRLGHRRGFHPGAGELHHHAVHLGHKHGFHPKEPETAQKPEPHDLRLGHKRGFHHISGQAEAIKGDDLKGFIVHHTGGRGTVASVQDTLRQRGLGVEYVMDRDGNIVKTGERGAAHILPGWGPKGTGLSNKNVVGMEVIARDDKDVTPAQVAAAKAFIAKNYPGIPVFGHGEVNPGHKEADEGMSIVNAIRAQRSGEPSQPKPSPREGAVRGSWFDDRSTATGLSAATTAGIALPTREGLGKLHEVTGPSGKTVLLPQIDLGPAKWTGRGIDISKAALSKLGYTEKDFPTDAFFSHRRADHPTAPKVETAKPPEDL